MFMIMRRRLTMAVFVALFPAAAAAQEADSIGVRGWLIDASTALPVPRVQVLILRQRDTVARVATDSVGAFSAPARRGDRLIAHFLRIGYQADSIEFTVGEMPLRVAMNSTVRIVGLDAITVKEKAFNSFQRRAGRSAAGTFISLEKIEQRKPHRTSELLRGLGGVTIGDSLGIVMIYSARANISRRRMALPTEATTNPQTGEQTSPIGQPDISNCAMRVRIDGILQPPGSSLDDIRPKDIYGIEVYGNAAAMPAEYQGVQSEAECGLILIWLKRSRERLEK